MDNIQSEFVSASTGIDFGAISSDTNGKGVYMRAGTENDAYPIVYYRGAVDNNNVVFNNKCWKAVRTTDTGGVKLIYNGETGNVYDKVALSQDKYDFLYEKKLVSGANDGDVRYFALQGEPPEVVSSKPYGFVDGKMQPIRSDVHRVEAVGG